MTFKTYGCSKCGKIELNPLLEIKHNGVWLCSACYYTPEKNKVRIREDTSNF